MVGLIEKNLCKCKSMLALTNIIPKKIEMHNVNAPVSKRILSHLPVKGLIKEKYFFTVVWIIYTTSYAIFTRYKPKEHIR
jgi:hypothetical protein